MILQLASLEVAAVVAVVAAVAVVGEGYPSSDYVVFFTGCQAAKLISENKKGVS